MTRALQEEIAKLTSDERLQLIGDLWDGIAEEAARRPPTEAQKAELDRRMAMYQDRPDCWKPWEDVKRAIRNRK